MMYTHFIGSLPLFDRISSLSLMTVYNGFLTDSIDKSKQIPQYQFSEVYNIWGEVLYCCNYVIVSI